MVAAWQQLSSMAAAWQHGSMASMAAAAWQQHGSSSMAAARQPSHQHPRRALHVPQIRLGPAAGPFSRHISAGTGLDVRESIRPYPSPFKSVRVRPSPSESF